ncbi:hypothetical protein JZ751_012250 [Albula glossodonta]|uniref:Uncharacterized protein n=1 Tax=Albula glossodonta TaxID=121402 RepID=A0A8T2PS34_9TELE|nr:hypothetical protein JZ751_012250 [Albula glossodonta]
MSDLMANWHLMGKKSTDNLFGSVERERISYQPLPYPQEGKRPGGHLEAFKYVRGLLRALAGLERQNAAGLSPGVDLDMRREWEQRERDRTVREATDYLLQVWSMKDQDSS